MGASASVLTTEQRTKLDLVLKNVKEGTGHERHTSLLTLHGMADNPDMKAQLASSSLILDALSDVLKSTDNEARKLATVISWSLSFGDGCEENIANSTLLKELIKTIASYTPQSPDIIVTTISNACATLWNLLTTDRPYNRLLMGDPKEGLVRAIINMLEDTDINNDLFEKSTAILKFLSEEEKNRLNLTSNELIMVIAELLSFEQPTTRNITIKTKRNLFAFLVNISDNEEKGVQTTLSNHKYGLLPILVQTIQSRKTVGSDFDVIKYACQTAWNMVERGNESSINLILPSRIHLVMIEIVQEAGHDVSNWSLRPYLSEAFNFLMNFATYPIAANALRSTNLLTIMEHPLANSHRMSIETMSCELLKALFIAMFLVGSDEAKKDEQNANKFIKQNPLSFNLLFDVYKTALAGKDGHDYPCGTFALPLILHAILQLSLSEVNQGFLLGNGGIILHLLKQTLQKFVDNDPPIPLVGGGGDDIRTASRAMQSLLSLSFYLSDIYSEKSIGNKNNTDVISDIGSNSMHQEVRQQFLRPEIGLETLLTGLIKLSTPPKTTGKPIQPNAVDEGAITRENIVRDAQALLIRLVPTLLKKRITTEQEPATPSIVHYGSNSMIEISNQEYSDSFMNIKGKKHVMVSYAWGARKDLVTQFVNHLRSQEWGFDVWQDISGSKLVKPMQGSTDECMATAIEASHTVIICVSKQYKASANCRLECSYAHRRFKQGALNIYYVMMDPAYTTVSNPETVDGWLGLYIGDHLWYNLFSETSVETTANEIGKLIEGNTDSSKVLRRGMSRMVGGIHSRQPGLNTTTNDNNASGSLSRHPGSPPAKLSTFSEETATPSHPTPVKSISFADTPARSHSYDGHDPATILWQNVLTNTTKHKNDGNMMEYLKKKGISSKDDLRYVDEQTALEIEGKLNEMGKAIFKEEFKKLETTTKK